MSKGALAGLRVLDLTDERAIYGAKLLADLGASVVRPEPLGGDILRQRGPFLGSDSLYHRFFASSRTFITIDPDSRTDVETLQQLVANADVVLTTPGAFGVSLVEINPNDTIVIDTTSFGNDGPWRDFLAPDLVAGALGGIAATTGDVDTPPLKVFGELNFMTVGAYVAIAALSALYCGRIQGVTQQVDLSVHECIVSCLEHVLMHHWYAHTRPARPEPVLPRRGSLHWSNAYEIMAAKGGSIMVTPTPNIPAHLDWLEEVGAISDLRDPKYREPEHLHLFMPRLMAVTKAWVATQDVETLFHEAQERHMPYGWVLPIEKVADNPQLSARDWWIDYGVGDQQVRGPGAPYHFSETPWRIERETNEDEASNIVDLWTATGSIETSESNPASDPASDPDRPLTGLRVLDFSHVLAGPFATRLMADMGADVVRVNSAARATGANDPNSAYYVTFSRNKRSLALDMKRDEARSIGRQLADKADIVIDNFSPGVLDRWGLGFEDVRQTNPGAIFIEMSGMGDNGPWSRFVTFAPTIHALAGLSHLTSVPGREDIGIGVSYNDHQAGLHGAVAVLAALEHRAKTGEGQRIDVSQFELGVNFCGPSLLDWFGNQNAARPTGNALPYDQAAPHNCFRCLDDASDPVDERWIAIAVMTDTQWQALKQVMDLPEWAEDPDLDSVDGRLRQIHTVESKLGEWCRSLTAEDVMTRCQSAGVPAGIVQNADDLIHNDPQLAYRTFLGTMSESHPAMGTLQYDRLAMHFTKTPCDRYDLPSLLGEDNVAVLTEWLDMDVEDIRNAEDAGYLS
ncbi:MAG: CoA transferase [Pseudomonadota bacterium]